MNQKEGFYGWWISIAAFFTFGLAVGIPYYGMPFFYDYYEKAFGWQRSDIVFGFPLAAVCMLWFGPVVIPKFSPRKMIVVGTGLTALAFIGFGTMGGNIYVYWGLWLLYMAGYILSGPISHQILISQWFRKDRGKAMAATYLGVGLFGGLSAKLIAKPLTEMLGFQGALLAIGGLMVLAWPLALLVMKDKPSEMGQFPDGDPAGAAPRIVRRTVPDPRKPREDAAAAGNCRTAISVLRTSGRAGRRGGTAHAERGGADGRGHLR